MTHLPHAELYAFHLQNTEPSFYTRIPQIIDYLTYDFVNKKTGVTEVRRLSVHAKELYRVIKSIAGDKGACWKNRNDLADHANMSVGMITKCKEELSQKFHQLSGTSLIEITKKKKSTLVEGIMKNQTDYDLITVVDIWNYNNAYFRIKEREAMSCGDIAGGARSCGDIAPQEARSPGDTNKNSSTNNPLSNQQQPPPSGESVVFDKEKKRLFSSGGNKKAYEWLLQQKCPEATAFSIATRYTPQDISEATGYLRKESKKSNFKIRSDKWAYVNQILKNRYWEKVDVS